MQQSSKKKVLSVGNYRFTGKVLGKGNFARVEEAVHNILNVKVAVKIMDIQQIKEEYVIKNLHREAKIMSKLNHPCIVALFQTMQRSDNVYYLVTELVSGGDLCTFIKGQRHGRLEEKSTRLYARQFVSALSHMHALGVVHRDLKMENVMLNSVQTQIKIVDFGLSNTWNVNNPLRTHCGSPEYAAPELFVTGKEYGAEVDLWSLGIILYGMVVGQLPFVSARNEHISSQERRKRLVAQINKGLAAQHRRAIAHLSADFQNMMNRLLISEPLKRITIQELIIHPWITERGKKTIRTNPLKQLDSNWHAKIVSEISNSLQLSTETVMRSILQEPLGRIGGIYNILIHKHTMNMLNGDGIVKTSMSIPIELNRPQSHLKRSQKALEKMKIWKKVPSSAPERQTSADAATLTNQETPKKNTTSNRLANDGKKISATSPHQKSNIKSIDYRLIQSPTLRRKVYSAALNSKPVTPITPRNLKDKGDTNDLEPKWTALKNIIKDVDTKISTTNHFTKIVNSIPTPREKTYIRPATTPKVPENKDKCKSEPISGVKRPITGPVHVANRMQKRSNVPPTKTPQKSTKSTNSKKKPPVEEKSSQVQSPMESFRGCGDNIQNFLSPKHELPFDVKKTFMYDPIARSIAGYVVNNVPEKLQNLQWFKKQI